MPNLNPNSTNYVHSHEPNTNDLVQAMGYDPYGAPILRIDDTTKQHTSKNRVKMSGYEIIDYATFQYTTQEDVWDTVTSGTAGYTWEEYLRMVELTVGSDVGDEVIRQTKKVVPYIPGRMNEVSMAVKFGLPSTGVRRRFGIFDDTCGAYFEDGGDGTYYVVLRRETASGIDEERIAREDWSDDPLDGTGPSGITADPTAIQMMVIEYEWYGAGQVEFKFVIDNNAYPVHKFNHANREDHTWGNTPFLPIRVELTNYGGAAGTHTFYQGSHSVLAEGEQSVQGRNNSIANAVTGVTLTTANTFYPLVAIRLKSDRLRGIVKPVNFSGATLDNTSIFLRVLENPTITGGTWVSYGDDSPVEYNITATGFTGGESIETVFVPGTNSGSIYSFDERSITQIGRSTTTTLGDTSGVILVACAATNANKKGWGSLSWLTIR